MNKRLPISTLAWVRAKCASGEAEAIRLEAAVSRREMADAANVDSTTIWRWEKGVRRPRGEGAVRYASCLRSLARITAREDAA